MLTSAGERVDDEATTRPSAEIEKIVSYLTRDQRQTLVKAMAAFNEAGVEPPVPARPLGRPSL